MKKSFINIFVVNDKNIKIFVFLIQKETIIKTLKLFLK